MSFSLLVNNFIHDFPLTELLPPSHLGLVVVLLLV
nr:MAG TPA: hypothetical protein [Caudoviricetes sp.]